MKIISKMSFLFFSFIIGNNVSYGNMQEPIEHTCYNITVYSGGITTAYNCADCIPYTNVRDYNGKSKCIKQ